MRAPIYFKGLARKGLTFREALRMHAVARLALHPVLTNIQTSWVKMGLGGAASCLMYSANDLGGTLMNEDILRSVGTRHGQELLPTRIDELIRAVVRVPQQRTTLYSYVADDGRRATVDARIAHTCI
jgi:FO synthase